MDACMEIELKKLIIFGFHGLHKGEEIVGGKFEINLLARYKPTATIIKNIEDTIDYTQLLEIVKQRMKKPVHLLESLATEIASEIIAKFSIVSEVVITIYKLHPPIENFEGSVGVSYKVKR